MNRRTFLLVVGSVGFAPGVGASLAQTPAVPESNSVVVFGFGHGKDRALQAVEAALSDATAEFDLSKLRRVHAVIAGDRSLKMREITQIAERVLQDLGDGVDVTYDTNFEPSLRGALQVSLTLA